MKMMTERTYDKNELSQIAFNTNNKTLISACDSLSLATAEDKCPAGIHSKYSRVRIAVTDFSREKSDYLTFHLKPEEIRRIYKDVQFHRQMKLLGKAAQYQVGWQKKKPREDKILAEAMTISYEAEMGIPWKIKISAGFFDGPGMKAKATYNRHVQKFLTDMEFEDFLCKIVSYLDAWETVIGATYMRDLNRQLTDRFNGERQSSVAMLPNVSSNNRASRSA